MPEVTRRPRKSATRREPDAILELRVALDQVEPQVWRRLWVPDNVTLARLDRVIQAAMGWTNSHLHEFAIGDHRYATPFEDDFGLDDEPPLDDRRITLGEALGGLKRFTYLYDFGDHWLHHVFVERVLVPDAINHWPQCLAGASACPPEDVGGVFGYADFLAAMADPMHEEHASCRRWWGGPFDPAGFDVNAANVAIRALPRRV